MGAGRTIELIIFLAAAISMFGIGIIQMRSKRPVGFSFDEIPLIEKDLSDVKKWNRKHGLMWMLYGVFIMVLYAIGIALGNTRWGNAVVCVGLVVSVMIIILAHHKLLEKFKSNQIRFDNYIL